MVKEVSSQNVKKLDKIINVNYHKLLEHELYWHFRDFKENRIYKYDNTDYTHSKALIVFKRLIVNGFIDDDLQLDEAKNVFLKNLENNTESVRLIQSLLDGLNIERNIILIRRNTEYIKYTVVSHIKMLHNMIKDYYLKFTDFIRNMLFDTNLKYVNIYNFISNNQSPLFFPNEELYGSPFFKLTYSVRMIDVYDTIESYIPLHLLVFPMLNKMCTIMIDYKNEYKPFELYFLVVDYNLRNIKDKLEELLCKTMYLHLEHNPQSKTDMIDDFYIEHEKIQFGNIITNKIIGFIFNNLTSRHLFIGSEENRWLDMISSVYTLFDKDKRFMKSDLYSNIHKFVNKAKFNIDKPGHSWIDYLFRKDKNSYVNIKDLFNKLNSDLNTHYQIDSLVQYIFEEGDY